MTTNQERAAEVIEGYYPPCQTCRARAIVGIPEVGECDECAKECQCIAQALADAGLLTPDPKPRTLADMTREEQEACRWAQADFDHGFADPPIRVVIGKCYGGTVDIILPGGSVSSVYPDKIIPLPDLPRMVLPEEQATEETLDLPEPEDAPDGYYLVHWWGEEHPVPAEKVQGQWWVIGKETFLHPKDVFIVSRLVMEGWV